MPRDLEGKDRSKRRERGAPSRQSEARLPDLRDVGETPVRETISRFRARETGAEQDSGRIFYGPDTELRPDASAPGDYQRSNDRERTPRFNNSADARRVLDGQRAPTHRRAEPVKTDFAELTRERSQSVDIRSRETREPTGSTQSGQRRKRLNFTKEETPPAARRIRPKRSWNGRGSICPKRIVWE